MMHIANWTVWFYRHFFEKRKMSVKGDSKAGKRSLDGRFLD